MKNFEKYIVVFFAIGFLNTAIFVEYLKTTNRSSGEVGMIPIGIMLASLISLIVTFIILGIFKNRLNIYRAIPIYHLIYFASVFILGIDVNNLLDFNFKNIDLFILIIALFVWVLIYSVLKTRKNLIRKK